MAILLMQILDGILLILLECLNFTEHLYYLTMTFIVLYLTMFLH